MFKKVLNIFSNKNQDKNQIINNSENEEIFINNESINEVKEQILEDKEDKIILTNEEIEFFISQEVNKETQPFYSSLNEFSDFDVLFEDAARLIVIAQQGSASILQRKLKLGYNRAGRLIDQLEFAGIVGEFDGSNARKVLISDEVSLEKLLNKINSLNAKEQSSNKRIILNAKEHFFINELMHLYKDEISKRIDDYKTNELREQIKTVILLKEEQRKEKIKREELKKEILQELQEDGVSFNSNIKESNKRERISQETQDRVWNRDGGKCVKCGSSEKLEFDHIIPFSKGGSNTYRNLQLLCEKCNRTKSNKIG